MFLPLPPEPPPATFIAGPVPDAEVRAFSFDGRTVVGVSGLKAFVWTVPADREEALGKFHLMEASSHAVCVSDDGRVIGGKSTFAVFSQANDRNWVLGIPDGARPSHTSERVWGGVDGVSGNGQIVVGSAIMEMRYTRGTPSGIHGRGVGEAVIWRWGTGPGSHPQRLGLGWGSAALAISRDGRVVAGLTDKELRGFWWTQETGAEPIGDLPGGAVATWPRALSAEGKVIAGRAGSKAGTEAFRWTEEEGMVGLGDLPGGLFSSEALGVSADGTIVVGQSYGARQGESGQGDRAFIWDAKRGMRDLHTLLMERGKPGENLPKNFGRWRLQNAVGIRIIEEGKYQVAGTARDGGGARIPYVATLAEKPSE